MVNLVDFQLRPAIEEEAAWRSVIYAPEAPPAVTARVLYAKHALMTSVEAIFITLFGAAEHAFWLDSSREIAGLTRFSYMGDAAAAEVLRYDNAERTVRVDAPAADARTEPAPKGFFSYLRARLRRIRAADEALPFDFMGGFVGYLGYELKVECGGRAVHRSHSPDAAGLWTRRFLAIDHVEQAVYVVALAEAPEQEASARAWVAETGRRLHEIREGDALAIAVERKNLDFALEMPASDYLAAIERALAYIDAGDTYEVCLTNRIR